jgi:hypothetical protein
MFKGRDQRPRTWVIHLALASLLLVQSLGLLHRTVHTGLGTAMVSASASGSVSASTPQAHPHAPASFGTLFAGHKSDLDCRLFDQLAHADLAPLPVLAVPCEFDSAAAVQALPAGHQPAPERSYRARGPPVLA